MSNEFFNVLCWFCSKISSCFIWPASFQQQITKKSRRNHSHTTLLKLVLFITEQAQKITCCPWTTEKCPEMNQSCTTNTTHFSSYSLSKLLSNSWEQKARLGEQLIINADPYSDPEVKLECVYQVLIKTNQIQLLCRLLEITLGDKVSWSQPMQAPWIF